MLRIDGQNSDRPLTALVIPHLGSKSHVVQSLPLPAESDLGLMYMPGEPGSSTTTEVPRSVPANSWDAKVPLRPRFSGSFRPGRGGQIDSVVHFPPMKTFLYICLGAVVVAICMSAYQLIGTALVVIASSILALYLVWTWVEFLWVTASDHRRKKILRLRTAAINRHRHHVAGLSSLEARLDDFRSRLDRLHSR